MTGYSRSPSLIKGGLVLLDAASGAVSRVISLQYNPESLSRSLQIQAIAGDGQDRSQVMRVKAPAVETIKIDVTLDATDQLELSDVNAVAVEYGIHPQLALLETLVQPPSERLVANNRLASLGTLEIAPVEQPLTLFVWSKSRIVPVRITDLSVTEDAFDSALNPIRAKVSLGMRVLSINDLGFDHRGGGIFMAYLQAKEQLARKARPGTLGELGIGRIP